MTPGSMLAASRVRHLRLVDQTVVQPMLEMAEGGARSSVHQTVGAVDQLTIIERRKASHCFARRASMVNTTRLQSTERPGDVT
jgi:hypothetical protein